MADHDKCRLSKGWREALLLHALPETIALVQVAICRSSPFKVIVISCLLRLAWVTAEIIHGSGHTLARAVVDRCPKVLTLENLLEHRSLAQMTRALVPFAAIGPGGDGQGPLPLAWLHVGDQQPWKVRLKASGGPLLQGFAIGLASMAFLHDRQVGSSNALEPDLLISLIVGNGALLLASRSDWQAICDGQGSLLFCGNFGLLAAPKLTDQQELLSPQAIDIFERMGRETELRGAQAGGGLVMTVDQQGGNAFVGHKIVNAKRGDLTPSLETGFRHRRRLARRGGWRPHPAGLMACWHYRFGTSGPPAVRETHWLEWTPARRRRLWRLTAQQQWQQTWQTVHHRITHNGDFEAFACFGATIDVASSLGSWLEKALEQPSPAVVDSARIAGLMDLMICQGDWFAAVRWSFLCTLADYPNTPSQVAIEHWTVHFEEAFMNQVANRCHRQWKSSNDELAEDILTRLWPDPLLTLKGEEALRRWVVLAIDCFLHNDPCQAVKQFMAQARGSFGLVVVSTTWPDQLVLSSLGQPITVGVDPECKMTMYASESAAVDAILASQDQAWRIDLDENAGEVAVLSSSSLSIYSLTLGWELSSDELRRRTYLYTSKQRRQAYAYRPTRASSPDPVAVDIADIPALLASIRDDWSNPGSSNRQSAEELAQLLIAKAANLTVKAKVLREAGLDDSLAKSNHVDLLITGVENSLWLGEQFSNDLSALMPRLSVRALSANAVLQCLQHDIEQLGLARQSIVLVLSHSSRTFPSRQVMEASDLMMRRGVIRQLFILTGEPDSLLGSSMLRSQTQGELKGCRLFTTGAGRRRAEPATASVAAMHQTLTELLFALCRQLLQAFPDQQHPPLGMRISREELTALASTDTTSLLRESSEIVGADGLGQRRPTSTSRQLERLGSHWALHVLETPIAWAIHAFYILISVGYGLPLAQTLLAAMAGASGLGLLAGAAVVADVGIYIFGPWLWTLGLRWGQGRPLLARTGRRSVVIGESQWIQPLLTNYISKLFSLSFGIATVDVQGGDIGDHLLHTHAHRLVRGSLLFFGCPDGRGSSLKRSSADAALLTARQADGIRHWDTGPEIVAIGSESTIEDGPFRHALVLPSYGHVCDDHAQRKKTSQLIESIRESRFGSFRRLLAGYVFFWAMAKHVGQLPLLRFKWWRSQSRTRVMTTAAPVSAARLDHAEPQEIAELALDRYAEQEQS